MLQSGVACPLSGPQLLCGTPNLLCVVYMNYLHTKFARSLAWVRKINERNDLRLRYIPAPLFCRVATPQQVVRGFPKV